jgi:hypothetical protein
MDEAASAPAIYMDGAAERSAGWRATVAGVTAPGTQRIGSSDDAHGDFLGGVR